MGAAERRKGHNYERETAARFRALYPEARRGLAQPRSARETPDVDGVPRFWIECKKGRATNLKGALRQAIAAMPAGDTRVPIAVCKDDRCDDTVTMRLDDFLALLLELDPACARTAAPPTPDP